MFQRFLQFICNQASRWLILTILHIISNKLARVLAMQTLSTVLIRSNFSGRRHDINPRRDSLKINLLENNTVVISAKVDVAVHARTWIWKGVNFGFLGCMKITSCGGQVVTYKGKIDMKVSFQVFWNEEKKRVNVKIRPVDTVLSDVNVLGCRPPWYLW